MPELSPQDAKVYQDYLDARKRFDDANIFEIEKFYYSLPEGRDRDEFRQQYPILGEYEQWKNTYKAQHPEVIPFTTSEKNEMYGVPTGIQAVVYKYKADRDKQFPNIFKTQADYFMIKDKALRSVFLKKHPELTKYWDWKKAFEKVNPEVIPYIETPESIAEAMTREDYLNPTGEVYDQVQGYYNTRDRLFPGILDIQNMYYAKPAGTERKAFLKEYPELKDYWSFRRAYMAANPDAIPYIQSTESTAEDVLGEDYEDKYGVNFKPDPKDFTTPLVTTLMAYYATNKPLGKGSYDTLMQIWKKNGRPGGTFEVFLNYVLPNSLGSTP
jgi:hypothetical protein